MVGDPEIVDARLLRGAGRIGDERADRLRPHVAQVQAKLHAVSPTRMDAPVSGDAEADGGSSRIKPGAGTPPSLMRTP